VEVSNMRQDLNSEDQRAPGAERGRTRQQFIKVLAGILVLTVILLAQTGGLNIVSGVIDFSPAAHVLPVPVVASTGALPSTGCKPGELAIVTSAALGEQIYENSGSGACVWTQQAGAGGAGTPGATMFSSTTSAGPNDSAAETSLIGTVTGTTTIPANTFTAGTLLHVGAQGFFSLPSVSDSLTLKVKCGSTVLGSASFTPAAGALTNGTFRLWLDIAARGTGAGGSFITNGLAELSGSTLTDTTGKVLNTTAVAYDFTTTCVMDVTAQWGGAQVGELITGTNVAAWIPGAPVTSVNGLTGAVLTPADNTPTPGTTTNYYISTAGSDSNPCTIGSKCLTLAHALSKVPTVLTQQFIINVADGTYAEGIDLRGFNGYLGSATGITILGNTGTPSNVQFTGTVSPNCGTIGGTQVTVACLAGSPSVTLSGIELNATARDQLYCDNCYVILSNVTFNGSNTECIDSFRANIIFQNTIVCQNTNSAGVGAGFYLAHQTVGLFRSGTITITGPGGASTTAWGLNVEFMSTFEIIGGGNITITGVQDGVAATGHSNFSAFGWSGTLSITNSSAPSNSNGIFASNGSVIDMDSNTLTINHFTTCIQAIGESEMSQGPGNRTLSNCTATNPATSPGNQNSQITIF
jgi:hypothetical protein